jgi:hypothetical protein
MSTLAARAFRNTKRAVVGGKGVLTLRVSDQREAPLASAPLDSRGETLGRWAGPDNFEYFSRFVFPFGLNLLG